MVSEVSVLGTCLSAYSEGGHPVQSGQQEGGKPESELIVVTKPYPKAH